MKDNKLSNIENYSIGALTGLAEVLVTNPFFVIKTKIQQKKPWVLTPMAYYKGAFANALGFIPSTAIQVGTKKWMEAKIFNNQPTYIQQIGSAFSAGVLSSAISCPIEKIMILQNEHAKISFTNLIRSHFKTKGLSGFFVGHLATALRDGGFSVCFLAAPPLIKSQLKSYGFDDASANILSGISSGIIAMLLTQPFDTIKTLQQSSHDSKLGFFKIAKQTNLCALFKGSVARGSSLILSISFMDWFKEKLENIYAEEKKSFSNKFDPNA